MTVAAAAPFVLWLFSPVKPVEPLRSTLEDFSVVTILTCALAAIAAEKLRAKVGASKRACTSGEEFCGIIDIGIALLEGLSVSETDDFSLGIGRQADKAIAISEI